MIEIGRLIELQPHKQLDNSIIKGIKKMKLICELAETVEYELIEEEGKPKKYDIEGIFMQSEKKNKNGRIYPLPVLEKEVNRYVKEYVTPKRAFGELGHPDGPTVNLDRASHMITSLVKDVRILLVEQRFSIHQMERSLSV